MSKSIENAMKNRRKLLSRTGLRAVRDNNFLLFFRGPTFYFLSSRNTNETFLSSLAFQQKEKLS
jgi:hypothetical protein